MKSKITPILGMALSVAFIILLASSLHLENVLKALSEAAYWWLVPAIAVSLFSFVFRAQRFRKILASLKAFSLGRSYQYITINYMANNVLPARAGEVLLSYVVRQNEGIPVSSSLAVTLLGRVIDGLVLLSILLLTISFLPFPSWVIQILTIGFVVFGLVMAALIWLVIGKDEHLSQVRRFLENLAPAWADKAIAWGITQLQRFREGLLPLRSKRLLAITITNSIFIWLCESLVYFLVGQAFGLVLSPMEWLFLVSLSNLGTSIPSGPAGIGTFHGIVVICLGLLGVDTNQAAAYAVILHITQVVPVTIIGAISYFKLSFGRLRAGDNLAKAAQSMTDSLKTESIK